MFSDRRALITACYGLAVIASGLLSLLAREPGKAGLYFGLVMGGLALVASVLLWARLHLAGAAVAWLVVGFVGGWFVFDAFIKRGFGHGDLRKYAVIVLTALMAAVLCLPTRPKSPTSTGRGS